MKSLGIGIESRGIGTLCVEHQWQSQSELSAATTWAIVKGGTEIQCLEMTWDLS